MKRFKRGDVSSDHPNKLFLCYNKEKEIWITPERFLRIKKQGKKSMSKWISARRNKWASTSKRNFSRGNVSPNHPGLIFWAYWHYGMERWVTPEKFEQLRLQKNRDAKKWKPSEMARLRRNKLARLKIKTPEQKERANELQRNKRHIYSPRYRARRRAYKKMRRATDPIYRLKANIGSNIRCQLTRRCVRKSSHVNELLGCTYDFFRGWLENQFDPAMNWMNYGSDWHVDHILAIDLFDITDPVKQKMAFNYRNCRPLWGPENLSKNNRLDPELVNKYHLEAWVPFMIPQNVIPFKAA